jgi:hypothetical protein
MRRTVATFPLLLRCSVVALALPAAATAQRSLAPLTAAGESVTPVYEGWYRNHDGTYSLSFGYFNRNTSEVVDVPVGTDNFVAPGTANQGQPTHFSTRRQWGVFAVVVPSDFGAQKVTWTLKLRGQTYAISGTLHRDWEIDAIAGEASADNTPPELRFAVDGPAGRGPRGVTSGPLRTAVGTPLAVSVFVQDDGKAEPVARAATPVDLTWFQHQGPGNITFSPPTSRLTATGGTATVTATFSQPGEYLLRVRANDSPMVSAGHAQCCWTNGFVRVTVTP